MRLESDLTYEDEKTSYLHITAAYNFPESYFSQCNQIKRISTGQLKEKYFLSCAGEHVPRYLIEKLHYAHGVFKQSGIYNFYFSYSNFKKLVRSLKRYGDEINGLNVARPIQIQQLTFAFWLFGLNNAIAMMIFIMELIYYQFKLQKRKRLRRLSSRRQTRVIPIKLRSTTTIEMTTI